MSRRRRCLVVGDRQNPLIIRGDRLLLVLGAFIWRYIPPTDSGRPWPVPTPNPHGWSHTRICNAMEKLGKSEFLLDSSHGTLRNRESVYSFYRFLLVNSERLASVDLDVAPLIELLDCSQWCCCHGEYVRQVRRFFEAEANGKLTEADFKE